MSSKNKRPKIAKRGTNKDPIDPLLELTGARSRLARAEGSMNNVLYQSLACVAGFTGKVIRNRKLRDRFLSRFADERVAKSSSKGLSRSKLLLLATRYLLNAPPAGTLYDRARVYAKGLGVIPKSVSIKDIPDYIRKQGGIEKLCDKAGGLKLKHVNIDQQSEISITTPRDKGCSSGDVTDPDDETVIDGEMKNPVDGTSNIDTQLENLPKRKLPPRVHMRANEHLLVSMSENDLFRILARSATLTLRVTVNREGEGQVPVTLDDWAPC